jgi:hypothetical protein
MSNLIPPKQTGPKTPEGKARSSQNALKHGLTAQSILLPGEDPDEWRQHLNAYLNRFLPRDPVESDLVHRIAAAQWRIDRACRFEAQLLTRRIDYDQQHAKEPLDDHTSAAIAYRNLSEDYRALENLNRQEARLSREYDRALRELERLRTSDAFRRSPQQNEIASPRPKPPGPGRLPPQPSTGNPVLVLPVHSSDEMPPPKRANKERT